MSYNNSRPGDWACPSCSANCFASRNQCFKCGAAKPGGGGGFGGGGGGGFGGGGGGGFGGGGGGGFGGGNSRPGDWACPSCNANCFGSRSECFKCGTAKPEGAGQDAFAAFGGGRGGAGGGAGGAGGFSNVRPGDWPCPNCAANCFASRSECFKCGTAKPADA